MPSPWTLGSVTTRRSTWRPSTTRPMRPSWGRRFSAMSSSAMIFTRETAPAAIRRGIVVMSWSTPSMRKRTRDFLAVGREVDVRGAPLDGLADDLVDKLDDGRVFGALVQRDDLAAVLFGFGELLGRADDVFQTVQAGDQPGDVIGRRDGDADLVAGHDRDVVHGQDVGGVGHRHQQGALVGEGDRHGLVALGDVGADEVGGRHVDREHAQVEVVQAVALCEGAGEPVGGDDPLVEQDPLGSRAGVAGGLDRVVDLTLAKRAPCRR